MGRLLISSSIAAVLLVGMGIASAQQHSNDEAVTFTPNHREILNQHSTHQHYESFRDPHFHTQVGVVVPDAVQIHPLPYALAPRVPQGQHYGYVVVNDRPVIVDHSSRRIIDSFD